MHLSVAINLKGNSTRCNLVGEQTYANDLIKWCGLALTMWHSNTEKLQQIASLVVAGQMEEKPKQGGSLPVDS